jgi:hypothetical protein
MVDLCVSFVDRHLFLWVRQKRLSAKEAKKSTAQSAFVDSLENFRSTKAPIYEGIEILLL